METPTQLREKAKQARSLARLQTNIGVQRTLIALAEEYEGQAIALEAAAEPRPKPEPGC